MLNIQDSIFNSKNWDKLSLSKKQKIIKSEINKLCDSKGLPSPTVIFKCLSIHNAYISYTDNIIVFNNDLLEDKNAFSYCQDNGNTILSTIHHEIQHLQQYFCSKNVQYMTPIKLGITKPTLFINYENNIYKSSLYIIPCANKLLNAVYLLQPNEYEANIAGQDILKQVNPGTKSFDFIKLQKASDYLKKIYGNKNFVQEISNALMNLYDNGNRECSEEIMDLVTRCAICSYQDKEDYGVDKISLFLGENYEKSLKEKIQNQYDDYNLDC